MTDVLETQTITTNAGNYRVEFIIDERANEPENEGFVLALNRSTVDYEYGDVGPVVRNALLQDDDRYEYEFRSGATLVRYQALIGKNGVTLVGRDFRPVEPSSDRFERVYGIAWAPDDVPEENAAGYVRAMLAEWQAWARGDVFGFRIVGPDGAEVDACWGFYGFDAQREYAMDIVRTEVEYDRCQRIEKANLVGAGFVGLI